MQTDGGQRVPFIAVWPGQIPAGRTFAEAVWTLDASATTLTVAGSLRGKKSGRVHEMLCWRWRSQAAILCGDWKFVRLSNQHRYLFDMREIGKETADDNQIAPPPEIPAELEKKLAAVAATWKPSERPGRFLLQPARRAHPAAAAAGQWPTWCPDQGWHPGPRDQGERQNENKAHWCAVREQSRFGIIYPKRKVDSDQICRWAQPGQTICLGPLHIGWDHGSDAYPRFSLKFN